MWMQGEQIGVEGIMMGALSWPCAESLVVRRCSVVCGHAGLEAQAGQTRPSPGQQHPLAALADAAVYYRLGLDVWGGAARV